MTTTNCSFTRRRALQRLLVGAACLPFIDVWGLRASAFADGATPAQRPTGAARATSVIELWMAGGPSHVDTFDPKPEAGAAYCGPLDKPLPTNVDGIRISQLMPLLAQQADKYSLIRSMTHGSNAHETAAYIAQTGRDAADRLVYPGIGAVVTLFKGYDHGYKGVVPPYVMLTQPMGRFSETGFLGPRYRPFVTGGDPNQKRFAVEGVVAEGVSDERQKNRRDLMHELDTLGRDMPKNARFEQFDRLEDKPYDLILGDAGKLFDLAQEKDDVRDRYGRSPFGQSCLMARRLVERGVPYVTVNLGGWDTHKQNFETMRRKLPELDRGLATLLADLAERGLLDSTIVWCGGEFGRTPKVQWEAPWNGGRGHHGDCYSALVAGGGFKGGRVVGASDETGERVGTRPVHPRELHSAIYAQLGIDPDGPLPNQKGLDVRVTDAPGGAPAAKRLPEIV
jgi:hypothetical protein